MMQFLISGDIMLEKLHEHITNELQQCSRTDTIFVITAVLFNLVVLGINSAVAANATSKNANSSDDIVGIIFILIVIFVNVISIWALLTGKNTRGKLLQGLLNMYKDNNVEKYYNASLLTNYNKRYALFSSVILCLALTSIAIPLVIRIL
jgi:hypothetical protein